MPESGPRSPQGTSSRRKGVRPQTPGRQLHHLGLTYWLPWRWGSVGPEHWSFHQGQHLLPLILSHLRRHGGGRLHTALSLSPHCLLPCSHSPPGLPRAAEGRVSFGWRSWHSMRAHVLLEYMRGEGQMSWSEKPG